MSELAQFYSNDQSIQQLLNALFNHSPSHIQSQFNLSKTCSRCGLSLQQIVHNGKFGCSECFKIFNQEIIHIAQRVQHGADEHIGYVSDNASEKIQLKQRISDLQQKMEDAAKEQAFELAADYRDQLKEMKERES